MTPSRAEGLRKQRHESNYQPGSHKIIDVKTVADAGEEGGNREISSEPEARRCIVVVDHSTILGPWPHLDKELELDLDTHLLG